MDEVMGCHRKPEAPPVPSALHCNILVAQPSSSASTTDNNQQPTTITQGYKGLPRIDIYLSSVMIGKLLVHGMQ